MKFRVNTERRGLPGATFAVLAGTQENNLEQIAFGGSWRLSLASVKTLRDLLNEAIEAHEEAKIDRYLETHQG